MHKTAKTLDQKVREIAKKMINDQVDMLSVPLKGANESIFVTRNEKAIVAVGMVQVEGQDFFFGHKR
jgi:hypothetical protein